MCTHYNHVRYLLMLLLVSGILLLSQLATARQFEAPVPLLQSPQLVSIDRAHEAGVENRHSRRLSTARLDISALFNAPVREGRTSKNSTPDIRTKVTLEPFPGERFVVEGQYVEQWKEDSWTWVGAVEGHEHAHVTLSVTPSSHYGVLRVGPIIYEIRKGRDGHTYIREPDVAAYGMKSSCALGLHEHGSGGGVG